MDALKIAIYPKSHPSVVEDKSRFSYNHPKTTFCSVTGWWLVCCIHKKYSTLLRVSQFPQVLLKTVENQMDTATV